MIYLTAQPDKIKFYWQLKVQLENFMEKGIDLSSVHVLVGLEEKELSNEMKSLASTGAKVFSYSCPKDRSYLSSVRPHIIAEHFKTFPKLSQKYIFYLDSDVIFNRLPDYSRMDLSGSWYVSDTISYIGAQYIKGRTILDDMCKIVGIHPELVKSKEDQSGGAQYIMIGTDYFFLEEGRERLH